MLGPVDEVIREVERAFPDLTIIVRGNRVAIVSRSKQTEAQAAQAEDLVNTIIQAAYTAPMDADTVRRMLDQNVLKNHVRLEHPGHGPVRDKLAQSTSNERAHARSAGSHDPTYRKPTVPGVITFAAGVPVRAKTAGQVAYVNAIESHTITFGIGPAGTGKTYLAVAKAVRAFQDKQIRRIILTRPAVEAGESLGFLPGTLNDKVDPYLRPLYDALGDMLGADQLKRYMDDGSIEVAPLAYMRGRTLNDAFVILDEAQNTTEQQMKMFLTRLGFNTTMVITGDISQVDLTVPRSGLATIERILGGINDIAFVHLKTEDVVRHQLVGQIVAAYDRHSATSNARAAATIPTSMPASKRIQPTKARQTMSVDVTNETQWVIDPKVFSDLGIWVLDQMRVSTQSDLTIMFVDPDPIAELHMRWMNLEGPTDVMSFPMDELRPGDGKTVMEGVLGDIVICPWVAAQQAAAAGHSTMQEMLLLTIHGILHLLGYDHVTPEQERQMFGLQRQLLLTFFALRHDANVQATLPAGTPDALALYDAAHGAGRDLDSK